jgi:molecular chaperone DnaK
MARATIDFGIDLGTTNSSIAVIKGRDTEVFKNNENFEFTPSAVWIDKNERLYVGRRAKERLEDDPENAKAEFKLQMGTDSKLEFKRSGRLMRPEELSAEVLKSLRADVKQRTGEEIASAVITVPAAFELPQTEATQKAARLAGLQLSPLLQEPVAAALAYGFQQESDKVYWLVYDFGGGTFDAALIQVRDGHIQVVNHDGDNHLGGKLIDWAIVEKLLIPAAIKGHNLPDFRRGNSRWLAAVAKLKLYAEQAKIRLSRDESAEVMIEFLCVDADNQPVRFEHELLRRDVESVIEPFIRRSITKCKQVIAERHLAPGQVQKLVLVGGPTLTPHLREMLEDPKEGLGIPLDFSVDPLTIVARGAAYAAATQLNIGKKVEEGKFGLELSKSFRPVGTETEPLVGGKIIAPGRATLAGFTIEFIKAPHWRSGKLSLKSDGAFMTQLWAERDVTNTYRVELMDSTGSTYSTDPAQFNYTIGLIPDAPMLIQSIGLALANNGVSWLLKKGTSLPAAKTDRNRRTSKAARAGQAGDAIRIVVVEGSKDRADRNSYIGELTIEAQHLRRDLPVGSEVEVSLQIDASRLIKAKAYIPILNEEFEGVIKLEMKAPDADNLTKEFEAEKLRLANLRVATERTKEPRAGEVFAQIHREQIIEDITAALDAAKVDRDAADNCQKRLLELRRLTDEIEDAVELPTLEAEIRSEIVEGRRLIPQVSDRSEERQLEALARDAEEAIRQRDPDILRRKLQELKGVVWRLYCQIPEFWIECFQNLEKHRDSMQDPNAAAALFAQGARSIKSGDVPALSSAVRQLWGLLPDKGEEFRRERGHLL